MNQPDPLELKNQVIFMDKKSCCCEKKEAAGKLLTDRRVSTPVK